MKNKKFEMNFLCVGFNKCGTTTLERMLKNNKEIYLPKNKKETLFFGWCNNYDNPVIELQKKYYPDYINYNCVGSIEPSFCKRAKDVYKYFGKDVKLIFMMRNPIQASFSLFKMRLRRVPDKYFVNLYKMGHNDFEYMFQKYIDDFIVTKRNGDFYYDEWINEYLKYYKKEQMKFIIFEKFVKNPEKYLKDIYDFLGVSNIKMNGPLMNSNQGNKVSRNYFCANINHLIYKKHLKKRKAKTNEEGRWLKYVMPKFYRYTLKEFDSSISSNSRNKLEKIYCDSINRLEKIIEFDLGKGLWY